MNMGSSKETLRCVYEKHTEFIILERSVYCGGGDCFNLLLLLFNREKLKTVNGLQASNNAFDLKGVCGSLFCQRKIVFGACHLVVITFGLLLRGGEKIKP